MCSLLALALILSASWTLSRSAGLRAPAVRLTLGLGACSALGAAFALSGTLRLFPWILALLGAPTIVAAARLLRRACAVATFARSRVGFSILPLGALVSAGVLTSLAPVVEGDSITYHMPIVLRMVADDQLSFWPAQWRSAFPQAQEVLAAVTFVLGGNRPGLLTGVEFALAAALLVELGERWLGSRADGHWSAAVALGGFAPLSLACSLKPDLLLLDAAMACALVANSLGRAQWRGAAAVGCFAGIMMACKYTGLPLALAAFGLVIYRTRTIRSVSAALATALAMGGFWYVRNAIVLGNPVPPFFAGTFRSFMSPEALLSFAQHRERFGSGHTVAEALMTPMRMFVLPAPFGGMGNLPNPVALLGMFAPMAVSQRRAAKIALPLIAGFYLVWFFSLQNPRLLLPVWAMLSILAVGVLRAIGARSRSAERAGLAIVAAIALISAAVPLALAAPAVLDSEAYLRSRTPFYDDILWMNAHLAGSGTRVATTLMPLGYMRVPWLVLDPYVDSEIAPESFEDAEQLDASLRRSGITHVFGPTTDLASDEWRRVRERARTVYASRTSCVCGAHALTPGPLVATEVLELGEGRLTTIY